jgi:hypothetical protein
MRINLGRVRVYPWHSINLIPQFSIVSICENEYPHKRDGSLLELVVLGYVLHVLIPQVLTSRSTKLRGPLWSKRKKKWYRAPK